MNELRDGGPSNLEDLKAALPSQCVCIEYIASCSNGFEIPSASGRKKVSLAGLVGSGFCELRIVTCSGAKPPD